MKIPFYTKWRDARRAKVIGELLDFLQNTTWWFDEDGWLFVRGELDFVTYSMLVDAVLPAWQRHAVRSCYRSTNLVNTLGPLRSRWIVDPLKTYHKLNS